LLARNIEIGSLIDLDELPALIINTVTKIIMSKVYIETAVDVIEKLVSLSTILKKRTVSISE
jgi:hypothetical protein